MTKRNINLDIYRSICALLVLGVHIGSYTGLGSITAIGASGLYGFFVLTGYLSMQSFRDVSLWDYYKNRLLRILPVYYLALFIDYIANVAINWKAWGGHCLTLIRFAGLKICYLCLV